MNNKEFAKTLGVMLADASSIFPLVGDGIQVDELPNGFIAQKFVIVDMRGITRKKFTDEKSFPVDSDTKKLTSEILKWFGLLKVSKSVKVKSTGNKTSKPSWISEINTIIQGLGKLEFTFEDIYKYEDHFKTTFPSNSHPKSSVLRSLQILRDQGVIEFTGRGLYKLIK